MEILKAIDSMIATFIGRWVLALTATILALVSILLYLNNKACQISSAIKVKENATLNASLDLQNSMIQQHASDMKILQNRLKEAYYEVNKRQSEPIKLDKLEGNCDKMVDKVIEDVTLNK